MRFSDTLRVVAGTVAVVLVAAACSGGDGAANENPAGSGKLTIGIKFDQPGLSIRDQQGGYRGYDVEIAKYVAGKLGVHPDGITFKEAPSAQRETLIMNEEVDFVVATYSITEERKEKVDFAGPYFVAGQALLVRMSDSRITGVESLNAETKVCSVHGSTAAKNVKENLSESIQLLERETYSQCVAELRSGSADAVTTDDIILAGFAGSAPGELKLVGDTFSLEEYGIGVKKGDHALRAKINDAIDEMIADGSWQRAFEATIGPLSGSTLTPPKVNRY